MFPLRSKKTENLVLEHLGYCFFLIPTILYQLKYEKLHLHILPMKGSVMFSEGRIFDITCHYREMTGICVSNANRLWGHLRYFCSYILLEKIISALRKRTQALSSNIFISSAIQKIFSKQFSIQFLRQEKKSQTLSWPYIKSMSQLFQPGLDVCLPN